MKEVLVLGLIIVTPVLAFFAGRKSKECDVCQVMMVVLEILEEHLETTPNDFFKGAMWVVACVKEVVK